MSAMLSNLHTHTPYCDGRSSMEEMVLAALGRGFASIGFSPHGPAAYDEPAMKRHSVKAYMGQCAALRQKYAGQIEIYMGMEVDALAKYVPRGLDYIIGSVHYVKDGNGRMHCIEYNEALLEAAVSAFGGPEGLCRAYAHTFRQMLAEKKPQIAGHIDIIAKLNRNERYFCGQSPWYRQMEDNLAAAAKESGCIVEVNTSGLRHPVGRMFPGPRLMNMLIELDVPLTISADVHDASLVDFGMAQAAKALAGLGCKRIKVLSGGRFIDAAL